MEDTAPHILVVDDHRDIRDPLAQYLKKNGFRAMTADGGTALRAAVKTQSFDLIILDIMMPGEDGLTLCRFLRETTNTPIILLTAISEETDKIIGLEMGADDYVTKPFNPRELLARIKAVIRRAQSLPVQREPQDGQSFAFEDWVFNTTTRELTHESGDITTLSSGEFALLSVFVERPNMVLTRDQLIDLTKGRNAGPFDRAIDNQVSRLRKKIEKDPKNPVLVQTVWGGGYKFSGAVEKS
ncbi:MAG: DNA-binding response regulator [Hyphomicrobiales bacterium]|nr:response regulator [Hyphomicrobiales bacterium]PCJ95147.1 MAG: DNA-binding response regulator [Hyphomicrobiales bacterium]